MMRLGGLALLSLLAGCHWIFPYQSALDSASDHTVAVELTRPSDSPIDRSMSNELRLADGPADGRAVGDTRTPDLAVNNDSHKPDVTLALDSPLGPALLWPGTPYS